MRSSRPFSRRFPVVALALVLAVLAASASSAQMGEAHGPTHGPTLSAEDLRRLGEMAADTARAAAATVELKAFLQKGPEGNYRQWTFNTLLLAELRGKAPVPEITATAESLLTFVGADYMKRVGYLASLAEVLADRPDGLDSALTYSRRAREEAPPTPDAAPVYAVARSTEGLVLLRRGDAKGAIAALLDALPDAPDSQRVLTRLGQAYELAKRDDNAIRAYLNALGAYPGGDSSAYAPLRGVWQRKHGSLSGLDEAVRANSEATLRRVALDQRKVERVAPELKLPDLADSTRTIALTDFKDRIVVIDFWGSWCGPCRQEMPLFQALAEKYKGRAEVVFMGVNWERGAPGTSKRDKAKAFADQMKVTFPNAIDLESTTVRAWGIQSFPTVLVVDRAGTVRFENIGLAPRIDEIIAAQIESLLGR